MCCFSPKFANLGQGLAKGRDQLQHLGWYPCCVPSFRRVSLPTETFATLCGRADANFTGHTHTGSSHCVWTKTEKEKEILEVERVRSHGGRTHCRFLLLSLCAWLPPMLSGHQTPPVQGQKFAWFREEHDAPVGSFLTLPHQLSSARLAQITSQVLRLLRKEAVSSREGRSLPRQLLCSDVQPVENISFPLQH